MTGIPARLFGASALLLLVVLATPSSTLGQNITVKVKNGDLLVKGDNQGNQIAIRATDTAGSFTVQGLNGELINGIAGFADFAGVNDDIKVDLRGGDNQLLLTARDIQKMNDFPFEVPDDLSIKTRSGNDSVIIDSVAVGGNTVVKTGSGDDAVTFNQVDLAGPLSVKTGSGGDSVNTATFSVFGGKLKLQTGSGDDCTLLAVSDFEMSNALKLGSGNDLLAIFQATFEDDLKADGGRNDDESFDAGNNTFLGAFEGRNFEGAFSGTITDVINLFNSKPSFQTNVSLLSSEGTPALIL